MDPSCKTVHLLLHELNYELRIRGVTTERPHDEKRKILGRLWTKERQQCLNLMNLTDPSYDFKVERVEIESSLNSIITLVNDFEGPVTDSSYKRATSRLFHITLRIQRIKLVPTDDDYDQILKFKNESYATTLKVEADLQDKVVEPDQIGNLNSTISPPNLNTSCSHMNQSIVSSPKSFPVYKLGVQFDGEPNKLLSFIEKVEELALSRHVSKKDLFESAAELFCGKATFWLRHTKPHLSDWDSLVVKLKQDFLQSDFDDEIWQQIRSRKQGRTEPVILYISCLEALFKRISHKVAENTKIKYIRLGLHQEFRDRLALIDLDSVEKLGALCKKLEDTKIVSYSGSSSTKNISILTDPELAYISDNQSFKSASTSDLRVANNLRKKGKTKNVKNTVNKHDVASISRSSGNGNKSGGVQDSVVCWKCQLPNHTFRNCKARINKIFCYKCGTPDITTKNCKVCKGND